MNRFWVAGSGNWSDNTNHWSASSGGAPGASLPVSTDDVFFDTHSGLSGATVNTDVVTAFHNFLATTGVSWTINWTAGDLHCYGNMQMESGLTINDSYLYFEATDTGHTIDLRGCALINNVNLYMNGVGGGWKLLSDVPQQSDSVMHFYNGTFDANGFNIGIGGFDLNPQSSNVTVHMGSGTWTITSNNLWTVTEGTFTVTLDPGTSTIVINNLGYIFAGGSKNYNNLKITGGANGTFIFKGSNTFNAFTVDAPGVTLKFDGGTTQTFVKFSVLGASGNMTTIDMYIIDLSAPSTTLGGTGTILKNSATWAGTHDAASGDSVDQSSFPFVQSEHSGSNPQIERGFFVFDTSSIPVSSTILSATFHMAVFSVADANPGPGLDWVNLVKPDTQNATNALVVGDYNKAGAVSNPTEISTRLFMANVKTYNGVYPDNPMVLNDLSIINVGPGAVTKMCLRSGNDCLNTDLTSGANTANGVRLYTGQISLEVTYSNGTQHNLSQGSGIISCNFAAIKNSNAIGGAKFYAGPNSINNGNNNGWVFTGPLALAQIQNIVAKRII